MTTVEELEYYCKEPEPVGALMLTGEWGCGKTYLIEHVLKEKLSDSHIILRISLFGISSIGIINEQVHNKWTEAYLEENSLGNADNTLKKWQNKLSKLPFPDTIHNIISFDPRLLLDISNELNNKKVVLVFDDLERCKLNTIDVLGCINEYCENGKFYTIVIANEDKINNLHLEETNEAKNDDKPKKENDTIKILLNCQCQSKSKEVISYAEIKEKIIERTIKYVPDYISIVHTILENMPCEKKEYHDFLKTYEIDILNVFAPETDKTQKDDKRPHNIRSLKCAIQDFYRVYKILNENGFTDLNNWLISFITYMISFKANIAKKGRYGTLFTDEEVKNIYPEFRSQYILKSSQNWILHGEWDLDYLSEEIALIKNRNKAKTPYEIVKTHLIIDLEEETIFKGFPQVLDMAYKGELTLNEYVNLIKNCYWIRKYDLKLHSIDWKKINSGIELQIQQLINTNPADNRVYSTISDKNKEEFLSEEWEAFEIINQFRNKEVLLFETNKNLYLNTIKDNPRNLFYECRNKRFNSFDIQMATATAMAFEKADNANKNNFGNDFRGMWKNYQENSDINIEQTKIGFKKLLEFITELKKKYKDKNIALLHTENFISILNELIGQ